MRLRAAMTPPPAERPVVHARARLAASLERGVVQIVWAHIGAALPHIAAFASVASSDELAKAARFRHAIDAQRHLIGRGLVRHAIGAYTNRAPASLRFEYSAFGKPYLVDGPSFSITHSGHVVAVALSGAGRVGVDVEAISPLDDLPGLAASAFADDEREAVLALPTEHQAAAFFRIWSRKEALLKALGIGLDALGSFSVAGEACAENALLRLDRGGEALSDWCVHSIVTSDTVASALAWDQPLAEIRVVDVSGRSMRDVVPRG